MCEVLTVSERRACRVLGQVRRTQRYTPRVADDEAVLTANIVSLASEYGRYGYRRITALLTADGWRVNHKRVERIWRREGLKVPARHPKRGRLWLNDGSCIRLRPAYGNHVWAYDFVFERTPRRQAPEVPDGSRRVHPPVPGESRWPVSRARGTFCGCWPV